jgi:hypothetical protein
MQHATARLRGSVLDTHWSSVRAGIRFRWDESHFGLHRLELGTTEARPKTVAIATMPRTVAEEASPANAVSVMRWLFITGWMSVILLVGLIGFGLVGAVLAGR